jgi:hypothetical protein
MISAKQFFSSALVLSAAGLPFVPFAASAEEAVIDASFSQIAIGEPALDAAAASIVVFDNITANQTAGTGIVSTSSNPNTFMGGAYVLTPGTTAISGFDLYPVNATTTNYTGLKISVYVWGSVNTGTVNATNPAFSNLLGTYSATLGGTFTAGFYYPVESANPGVDPGFAFATPLALTSTTIGVTVNVQGTTNGTTYANANNLTSIITYGQTPAVGSLLANGYYRNGNSETNGNFTSGPRLLSGGYLNQGVALRVYSPVPEVSTWLLMGLGLAALALRRRGV